MSTDWNVICLNCREETQFHDANHMSDQMLLLIEHADKLARLAEAAKELAPILADWHFDWDGLRLNGHGQVDLDFFARHHGPDHELVPINEYGGLLEECGANFRCCADCDVQHRCRLKPKHEGKHAPERLATPAEEKA